MATHVSHASLPYPIKNARFTLLVPFLDADGDPTDPTTPDSEVSQDNGAFADAAEEVSTASGSNGMGILTLTGAETNNSAVGVAVKVASGPKATLLSLYPKNLAIVGSGTLSAGSAGGGTLGTILAYDVTGCFIRTTGGTGGGGTGGANNQARRIITYTPSTGAFTVSPNWETTPDNTTTYDVLLPEGVTLGMLKALNPATAGRQLAVDSSGRGLADLDTIKTQTVTCSAGVTVLASVGTAATSTAQTGDSFARIGANGASLSAIPWNAAWDAEVQSECDDALQALGFTATVAGRIDAAVTSRMASFTLPTNFSALLINASGHVSRVTLTDTLTTYTSNTPQTGDTYALANGASGFVAIKGVVDTISTNVTTALSRIGSITGSGVNTVLGFFKALLSKTATTPSDIGGTFDPATDSTEAVRDNMGTAQTGDAYAIVASGTHGNAALKALIDAIDDYVDTEVAAIKAKTDTIVDLTATRAEPGQGAPAATLSPLAKLDYVYKLARNKITQDATTLKVYADDGITVDHKATISDDATTYTRGELATGP